MSQTANYGLYTEDDATTKFKTWREKMNGTAATSNMQIIDRVLGTKADASRQVDKTLSASGWSEVGGVYQQDIAITGLTATQNVSIGIAEDATTAERNAACDAMLSIAEQRAGYLTIAVGGNCPSIDIPVTIILLG